MKDKKAIGQAIVFIENHLYEPIAAHDVAAAASYSYHHFHRFFHAVMGETIGSYIRGRRLTQAAWELTHSEKKVIDIALSLYFETAQGFTRAFKERYCMTPTQYRKNGVDVLLGNRQPAGTRENAIVTYAGLEPELMQIPKIRLMGLRYQTTVLGKESAAQWQRFSRQIPRELAGSRRFGVFEAGQACAYDSFHPDSEATAFVGVEIPEGYPIPDGMQEKLLCGGTYAKFIHRGAVATLLQTYQYIWGVWFPKSGLALANRDDFECYTERFRGTEVESSEIEIYFPIDEP